MAERQLEREEERVKLENEAEAARLKAEEEARLQAGMYSITLPAFFAHLLTFLFCLS